MAKKKKSNREKINDIIQNCQSKDDEVSEFLFQRAISSFTTMQSWISSECTRANEIVIILKKQESKPAKIILGILAQKIIGIQKDSEAALQGILAENNTDNRIAAESIQKISEATSELSRTVSELYKIRDTLTELAKSLKK